VKNFARIGLDTAKRYLEASVEDLVRTDLKRKQFD
jgi:hypothetical protein